jgi:hypothetical protein
MVPASFDFCVANFEPRCELRGDFHPFGELEPDHPLLGVVGGVHHIDRKTDLVEDVGDSDVLDWKAVASSGREEMTMGVLP